MFRLSWIMVAALSFAAVWPAGAVGDDAAATAESLRFFEAKVRPLLVGRCYKCHGPNKQQGSLRLDSRAAALAGGETGPALVVGEPEKSLLVAAINYRSLEMPPDDKLKPEEIATLTEWVQLGAPWPGGEEAALQPRRAGLSVTDEDRRYWAFQPVNRSAVPTAAGHARAENAIDDFVFAALEAKQLGPSPAATRRELMRRASFDLLGLPPSFEEVQAFVADDAPDAYDRLLDRLLASPRFGERWGRHWLDVVRFGQTNGYERDDEKPLAWKYRDYVIRALNEDKPYDRFVLEQLAGDELEPVTDDSLTATGFYRIGVWDDEPDDQRQADADQMDDLVSTTSTTFLGLTIGCARCHDHKFDPISQEDYYGLQAFLHNIHRYGKAKSETHLELNKDGTILKLPSGSGEVLAARERAEPPAATHLLVRGNAAMPGKPVEPRFITVLCGATSPNASADAPINAAPTSRGRRLALARWLASPEHPLTSRVIVNRLWHHHFGRGLVATPSDFGKTGAKPTHPELLDWLAGEFVDLGFGDLEIDRADPSKSSNHQIPNHQITKPNAWSKKRLHRLIMSSATYRQSSRVREERSTQVDPDNVLLWRQNLRRLEAEAIRDAVLAASGSLNLAAGGRGVFPTLAPEVLSSQSRPGSGWDKSSDTEQARRSVYIFSKRTLGVPLLESFDAASPDSAAAKRNTTTIAPQALLLLNSEFMDQQSAAFARRLDQEVGAQAVTNNDASANEFVRQAFRTALGRDPSANELRIGVELLRRQNATAFCKLLLNLNEFVYVD